MTLDEIKNMAREVGAHKDEPCTECGDINPLWEFGTEELCQFTWRIAAPLEEEIKRLRFCIPEGDAAAAMEYLAHCVEQAVAVEREACAKVCEEIAENVTYQRNSQEAADKCAAAIRARD